MWQVFISAQVIRRESLSFIVKQCFAPPAGNRQLLIQPHHHLVRPDAADFDMGDPRHLFQLVAHAVQINLEEALLDERRYALLDRLATHIAQFALHTDLGDRPIGIGQQPLAQLVKPDRQPDQ